MSVNVNTTTNTVTIQDANKNITIVDNENANIVNVPQPITNIVQVATPGPQGPAGTGGGGTINTSSLATTGSNTFIGDQIITGSITSTTGFTGSLFGTSSWATNAATASYVSSNFQYEIHVS
jgi:hypothetical protein